MKNIRYSLHIIMNKASFICYIPYLAPLLICLRSPDISVAILHSWVYLWRNQGNKKLYLPLSGADPQKLHSIIQAETLWTGSLWKVPRSCLLAGFSSYFRLLKSVISCHCALYIIAHGFLGGSHLPWAAEANGGQALRKGGMKLQVAKSGLALDHLIMKSNYRQA